LANTKISALSTGSAITATDLFPAVETVGVGPIAKTGTHIGTWVLGGAYLANLIANATGLYHTGVVNVGSLSTTGNVVVGVAANQVYITPTSIFVGNGSVSATINSTTFSGTVATANSAAYLGATAAAGYQTTAGLSSNVAALTANSSAYLGATAAAAFVQNGMSGTLAGNLNHTGANVTFSGANLTVTGTNAYFNVNSVHNAANLNVLGGMLYTSSNLICSGNLAVTGSNQFILGTSSVAANGYTYLPNKLLMQWGQLAVNSSTAAQTWPTAFATNVYSITATSMTAAMNVVVTTANSTKFTVLTGATANATVFWHAIGQ